jgi:hypothetical protein
VAVLTRNHRQEAMSRAYIHAVAGLCGLSCGFRDYDYGIDLTLHEVRRRGQRHYESGFKLDIQAKSTTAANWTPIGIGYDLTVASYDDLRDPTVGTPRILVVLVLPEVEEEWLTITEEQLLLRKAAYWHSLRGMPATTSRRSVRVEIPQANLFTVESLRALMDRIRRQEPC